MKDRITFYSFAFLAFSGVFTIPSCLVAPRCPYQIAQFPTGQPKSLRFNDKTGRKIEIGRYGNVLSLCGSHPIREGYAFAYPDSKSPGKDRVVFYSDKKLTFDLKSISFDSNVPAGAVPPGKEVKITAVVETNDGLFQATHEFQWTAGKDFLKVTRNIKKKGSNEVPLRWFYVILTLDEKDFSRYEDIGFIESCPSGPEDGRYPTEPKCSKMLRPAAWAVDKSGDSGKGLPGESSHDYFLLPKQAGKYDLVFGSRGDSHMLKDQSLTLNYVYRLEPKVSKKEPARPTK